MKKGFIFGIQIVMIIFSMVSCKNGDNSKNTLDFFNSENIEVINENYNITKYNLPEGVTNIHDVKLIDGKIYAFVSETTEGNGVIIESKNFDTGENEIISIGENYVPNTTVFEKNNKLFFGSSKIETTYLWQLCYVDLKDHSLKSVEINSSFRFFGCYENDIFCIKDDLSVDVYDDELNSKNAYDLFNDIYTISETDSDTMINLRNADIDGEGNIYLSLTKVQIDQSMNSEKEEPFIVKLDQNMNIEYVWENLNDMESEYVLVRCLDNNTTVFYSLNEGKINIDIIDDKSTDIIERREIPDRNFITYISDTADAVVMENNKLYTYDLLNDRKLEEYNFSECGFNIEDDDNIHMIGNTLYKFSYNGRRYGDSVYIMDYDGNVLGNCFTGVGVSEMSCDFIGNIYSIDVNSAEEERKINQYSDTGEFLCSFTIDNKNYGENAGIGIEYVNEYYFVLSYPGESGFQSYLLCSKQDGKCKEIELPERCYSPVFAECNDKLYMFYSIDESTIYREDINDNKNQEIIFKSDDDSKNHSIYLYNSDQRSLSIIYDNKFYEYNIADNKLTLVMNDIRNYGVTDISKICSDGSANRLVALTQSYELSCADLYLFDKSDIKKESKFINVACFDTRMSEYINKFNQENSEYVLKSTLFNDRNDLNMSIASGDIPDIIISDGNYYMNQYAKQGLFTDMSELIESDPEMKKEDYLEKILTVYKNENKVYQISPYFDINTMIAKEKDIEHAGGWDYDEFFKTSKKYGSMFIYSDKDKSELLMDFMPYYFNDFIDSENNKCDFENQNFIALLELINTQNGYDDYDKLLSDSAFEEGLCGIKEEKICNFFFWSI